MRISLLHERNPGRSLSGSQRRKNVNNNQKSTSQEVAHKDNETTPSFMNSQGTLSCAFIPPNLLLARVRGCADVLCHETEIEAKLNIHDTHFIRIFPSGRPLTLRAVIDKTKANLTSRPLYPRNRITWISITVRSWACWSRMCSPWPKLPTETS